MKLSLQKKILEENDKIAEENKAIFSKHGILAINMMSSPGAGKTTLLEKTLTDLKDKFKFAVIEGDLATNLDMERINKCNVPVVQINTGRGCHLNSKMINNVLSEFNLKNVDIMFIENVGNLVCPAGYSLGEDKRVVLISTPEGHDKPGKYPVILSSADLMVINKLDLMPYVDFDIDKAMFYATQVNNEIEIINVSCKTKDGIQKWYEWVIGALMEKRKDA